MLLVQDVSANNAHPVSWVRHWQVGLSEPSARPPGGLVSCSDEADGFDNQVPALAPIVIVIED